MTTSEQSATRLVAVNDLGTSQVCVVDETPQGALAVGISAGKPFAVSNRCRHLFASLGHSRKRIAYLSPYRMTAGTSFTAVRGKQSA